MANDKKTAEDIWTRVGELDEIPPEDNFDPDRVWNRMQAKMEAKRHSSMPRGVIFIIIAILAVFVTIGICVVLSR